MAVTVIDAPLSVIVVLPVNCIAEDESEALDAGMASVLAWRLGVPLRVGELVRSVEHGRHDGLPRASSPFAGSAARSGFWLATSIESRALRPKVGWPQTWIEWLEWNGPL